MTVSLVVLVSVVAVCRPVTIDAAPQHGTHPSADSFSRVRRELERTPAQKLKLDLPVPVATFRATVEQRRFMLSFDEWLRKEFELTVFQRQSQEWYAKCCGINLLNLSRWADNLDRGRQRRELRKLRAKIARELAEIEADKKK
jgi:hypothetical protein